MRETQDTWAALFCARQVEVVCYQLINCLQIACSELHEPGRTKDPFNTLLRCVHQADSLKQVVDQARFGVDIAEQCIFSLSAVTDRLHELQAEQLSAHQQERSNDEPRGIDVVQPTEPDLGILALIGMLRDLETQAIQVRIKCERWLARHEPTQRKKQRTGLPAQGCVFWVLVLGDLHLGAKDSPTDWEHILDQFRRDLQTVEHEILKGSPWDLLALVGDLIGQGQTDQFTPLGEMLDEHWRYWREKGWEPPLVAVPGNHDLVRPSDSVDSRMIALRDIYKNPKLQKQVFRKGTNYRKLIDDSFRGYQDWWEGQSKRWPGADSRLGSLTHGILPGDFAASLEKDDTVLGIVGLNSAFLHLENVKKTKSHLAICDQQFNAIGGPRWCGKQDACILLTHHPPEWLHKENRKNFTGSISTPGRFGLHICGHQHVSLSTTSSRQGSLKRSVLTNSSLCGRVVFATNKRRIHGYTAVKIERDKDGKWSYRLFPRIADLAFGWEFKRDNGRNGYLLSEADGGTEKEEFKSSRSG